VWLWDVAGGKEVRRFDADREEVAHLGLSADGQFLATGNFRDSVRVWDTTTGAQLWNQKPEPDTRVLDLHHPTFSPDGRTLVTGGWEGTVHLWEVATGKRRARLEGHQGWVNGFVFSPNGMRLLSGSSDTTALIWDMAGVGRKLDLAEADLNALWSYLEGADAARAYQAVLKLAAGASKAVPLLGKHLRPVPPLKGDRVEKRIADLGSARFATRQKATAELEKLGEAAESALRQALKRPLVPEVHLRLRKLLDRATAKAAPGRLRLTRALEALERAGTPEARGLLRSLSEGAPGAWLTEEARKGLRRLGG
jgi:hypothetical protein